MTFLLLILLIVDFIWLRSSFGKLTEGKFVGSLGGILTKFSSNNPYSFVKQFLLNIAIPNSTFFGILTMWGEVFVAVGLGISLVYLLSNPKRNNLILLILLLSLLGGMFLNLVFWFSAGWTSSSTDGLNLLMFFIQLIALTYIFKIFKIRF